MIHTEEKAQRNSPMRTAAYFVLHVFNNNKKHTTIKKHVLNIYKKNIKTFLTSMVPG